MKKTFEIGMLAIAAIAALCSCSKDDAPAEEYLPVTANNISGIWMLSEQCGTPLAEGSHVYLDIVRRDNVITIYDNIGTFYTDVTTGIYSVDTETGVISGRYDHYAGDWTHSYAVSELTSSRMVWTAVDDPSEVSVYVRVDAIPEDILAE